MTSPTCSARRLRRAGSAAAASCCALLAAGAAHAQSADRVVRPPPQAEILRSTPAPEAIVPFLAAPRAADPSVAPGEAVLDLAIRYVDGEIYNPEEKREDAVRLRAYQDVRDTDATDFLFVGPTIDVTPGETVRVTLHNELPETNQNCPAHGNINIPHCFNRTNLHSHGLWISPAGNSDNVLISIEPGVSFQYEWNIPADHPTGTFWYHPHLHGSTALQVSSGMAGFIIIRGDRVPTPARNGDVDTLLAGADVKERLVLLQQIQYGCFDATTGQPVTDPVTGFWICDDGQTGVIESYDWFAPGDWAASGRYTTINGEVLPTFPDATAGALERWRIAHAGNRETVTLGFRRKAEGSGDIAAVADAANEEDWIATNCPGDLIPAYALAEDGLTRAALTERTESVLQPGYRTDLVVVFPEAGEYCVVDESAPPTGSVSRSVESRQLLGTVAVGAGQSVAPADLEAYVTRALVAAAETTMPADVRDTVIADLENGLALTKFVPHPTVTAEEVTGTQSLVFNIDVNTNPTGFTIDGNAYDPNRVDRTLVLGGVDEWTLTSAFASHPFHIHVNPFQIVEILDPNGNDVSVTGEADDTQYANMKGVWKDTMFVKQGYRVIMRTRYQRYIGEFVLHCHILDHEDQGMMQNVSVVLPNAAGGPAAMGHGGHGSGHGASHNAH